MRELSLPEARRVVLAAQGLGGRAPVKVTGRNVLTVARRLHVLQLDSVNVLVRAHYLPPFSRIGAYPTRSLDTLVNVRHDLVELDAHQASLVPVELEPLFRWRAQARRDLWQGWRARFAKERPGYVDALLKQVEEHGPISVSDVADEARKKRPAADQVSIRRRDGQPYAESSLRWWRPSEAKDVLEGLLAEGRVVLAGRGRGFERLYDLPERVLPPEVRNAPTPQQEDATRQLVALAAGALGVATVADLAGYFALKVATTRSAARDLVEAGALAETRVEGWKGTAYLDAEVTIPDAVEGRALLSPFDSLTWNRDRTKRLFGFDFSFEIYVPAAKRRFGYYVLPFLLDDGLVARVDLKADRRTSTLRVEGAYAEPAVDRPRVAAELSEALRLMAAWLELERIELVGRGDLAEALSAVARA